MVTESRSLLLRATCYEDGGAPVARDGSQPAGANDAEALARPDASSQPCSEGFRNVRPPDKGRRTLHSSLPSALQLSRKNGTAGIHLDG
jgi:hypothetical protein